MDRVIEGRPDVATMIQIQEEEQPSRASAPPPLNNNNNNTEEPQQPLPPPRVLPRKLKSTRRTNKDHMRKELQQSALSQMQLTLELSPQGGGRKQPSRGGRKPSSSRSLARTKSYSSPSTASAAAASIPRSKLSLDQTVGISPSPIQEEETPRPIPRRKAPARASSDSVTTTSSGGSGSTAAASISAAEASAADSSKLERRRTRSSSRSRKLKKRKGKKQQLPTTPAAAAESSEESFKGDAPPAPPRKAPESPISTDLQYTSTSASTASAADVVLLPPSMPTRSVSLIVSKSTMSRHPNNNRPPRQGSGLTAPAGGASRPGMVRRSLSQRLMGASGTRSSDNSNSSPSQQPEDDASPPPQQQQQPEEDEKMIIKSSNGTGLETPKRSKRILNGLRRSFSFSKKGPSRSKSDSKGSLTPITPRRDLSSFLKNPVKQQHQQQPSTEQLTVSTVSTTDHSSSTRNSMLLMIDSPLPPQENSSFFNLACLRAELDDTGLVEGAEGMPIVDPQQLMTEVFKKGSGSGSGCPSLGGHLEQMEQENEQAEKDIEEASDIISLPPADSVPAAIRKVSRRKSSSKKHNKPRSMRRSSPNSKGQSVSFHTVIIREYERCVGDNPAVNSGPPISLGWDYLPDREVPVDHYESEIRPSGPRTRKDFFLTPQKRFHILLDEWGFCVQDICRAKDEAAEIKYQRQQSCFGEGPVPTLSSGGPKSSLIKKKKGSRSSGNSSSTLVRNRHSNRNIVPPPPPSPTRAQDRWKTSCPASPAALSA